MQLTQIDLHNGPKTVVGTTYCTSVLVKIKFILSDPSRRPPQDLTSWLQRIESFLVLSRVVFLSVNRPSLLAVDRRRRTALVILCVCLCVCVLSRVHTGFGAATQRTAPRHDANRFACCKRMLMCA